MESFVDEIHDVSKIPGLSTQVNRTIDDMDARMQDNLMWTRAHPFNCEEARLEWATCMDLFDKNILKAIHQLGILPSKYYNPPSITHPTV